MCWILEKNAVVLQVFYEFMYWQTLWWFIILSPKKATLIPTTLLVFLCGSTMKGFKFCDIFFRMKSKAQSLVASLILLFYTTALGLVLCLWNSGAPFYHNVGFAVFLSLSNGRLLSRCWRDAQVIRLTVILLCPHYQYARWLICVSLHNIFPILRKSPTVFSFSICTWSILLEWTLLKT